MNYIEQFMKDNGIEKIQQKPKTVWDLKNGDGMRFPYFDDDTMYKGMKENKKYSLEELDL